MKASDYIASFLASKGIEKVFVLTGGAAAFMIDAVGRHPDIDYVCFQSEQSAAMAADAVWRVNRKLGATMATSGPGATNLLTGIACSYFDSIPSIHITGQVNMKEGAAYLGATPRQAGFQETKIVEMARPITKYAVQVRTGDELKAELAKAYNIAVSGRMGPVLIDVPMDVQQMEVGDFVASQPLAFEKPDAKKLKAALDQLNIFIEKAERPLVYFGAGVGLSGAEKEIEAWLKQTGVPFVSSWNGETYFNHDLPNYCGNVGVYGNRGAHFLVQNCDRMLVLGSRLDNRQRSSNARKFAAQAKVLAVDIDDQELAKYKNDEYETLCLDLKDLPAILPALKAPRSSNAWQNHVASMRDRYFGKVSSSYAAKNGTQSPHEVIRQINKYVKDDAVIVNDTGAALCWFFQVFHRKQQDIFTAGGNSPMGYSLPAAIGAKMIAPDRQIICFSGDGGFQLNIQELALIPHHKLDMVIVMMNNGGYGIIKQFQDANLGQRHHASGGGYAAPDYGRVIEAYGLKYFRIDKPEDVTPEMFALKGGVFLDVILDPNTLIEPKVEMGRPINDQYPYMSDEEFAEGNAFVTYERQK